MGRKEKYKAKLDPDVIGKRYDATKDLAVKKQTSYFKDAAELESKVKAIVSDLPSIQHHFYIAFAEEIVKIMRNHTGETAQREVCITFCKWWMRGFVPQILNRITSSLVGMVCYETGLPWTGQLTVYAANDDGDYQKGYTLNRPIVKGAGSHRFVDNGDGTISDLATGLMWVKEPEANPGAPFNAQMTWANAIINCEALNFAGHTDWRLPNIKELISINDFSGIGNGHMDPAFFPNNRADDYWSSTTRDWETGSAYYVDNSEMGIAARGKANAERVRPVRAGQP